MRPLQLVCLALGCLFVVSAAATRPTKFAEFLSRANADDAEEGQLWALIIAGSAGWGNYRHQADVSHAYQVLRRGGLDPERIITMMYDDIAGNPENPHPGKIFNRPGGDDVYAGVPVDYSGAEVNAQQFLAVLAGDAEAATPNSKGHRKVLATGPNDRIFVYYSDHGAPGILGMPSGPFLYADQMHAVIANKSRHNGFKEMVMYIEACESGSMFEGLLEDDLQVYATTAANGHESSWGTYCPGMNPSPPPEFTTCLGDLYSVAWLENSDDADLTIETLKKQFQLVKQRTSQNFTFLQGSHVMRFGTLQIAEEPAADFMGEKNTGGFLAGSSKNGAGEEAAPMAELLGSVAQRDADLLHLYTKYSRASGAAKHAALRELSAEVSRRTQLDASVRASLSALLASSNLLPQLQARFGQALQAEENLLLTGNEASSQGLVELLVSRALPRQAGLALVDDWGCLRGMVAAWEGACGPLDQYGMQHTRAFSNLCNAGLQPADLGAAAAQACSAGPRLAGAQAAEV